MTMQSPVVLPRVRKNGLLLHLVLFQALLLLFHPAVNQSVTLYRIEKLCNAKIH